MDIAKTVKQIRKARGLNTKAFAALLGVSDRTVENWEQGRSVPHPSVLILLEGLKKNR